MPAYPNMKKKITNIYFLEEIVVLKIKIYVVNFYCSTHTTAQQLSRWATVLHGHNRHGPKSAGAAVPISVGELDLHLTQCRLGRGLPPYQVVSSSIQPFGYNRHGPKTGRTAVPIFWVGER